MTSASNRVYLDHAATTPCCEVAWNAMSRHFLTQFGNPNSFHSFGRAARAALAESRERISHRLKCQPKEVIITGGGTESNNLALRGAALARGRGGRHIVTAAIEHPSMLKACELLADDGVTTTQIRSDLYGRVSVDDVLAALRTDTFLVTFSHANSEIGTLQPIREIAAAVKRERPDVLVHVDAVQTTGHVPIALEDSNIDLLSFTAHKFYGPKGIGGLFVREDVRLRPLLVGGGTESTLRPGTEAVPLVVGMAAALDYSSDRISANNIHWLPLRDHLIQILLSTIEESRLNGSPVDRLSTNVNVSFRGVSGEDLVLLLDQRGYATSTGSACTTGRVDPSQVLMAIGCAREEALGALRITFGDACIGIDIDDLAHTIIDAVSELRGFSYRRRPPKGLVEASQ